MRAFTESLIANRMDVTSHGKVSNLDWCHLEADRLNEAHGKELFFVRELNDMVCIMTRLPLLNGKSGWSHQKKQMMLGDEGYSVR